MPDSSQSQTQFHIRTQTSSFSQALLNQYLQIPRQNEQFDIVILPNQRAKIFFLEAIQRVCPDRLQYILLFTLPEFLNRLTPHVEIGDNPLLLTSLLYANLAENLDHEFSLFSAFCGQQRQQVNQEDPSSEKPSSGVSHSTGLAKDLSTSDPATHFTGEFALLQILLKDLNILWHNLPETDTRSHIDPLKAMDLVAQYYRTGSSFLDEQFSRRYRELLKILIDLNKDNVRSERSLSPYLRLQFVAWLWEQTKQLLTPENGNWFQNRFIQRSIEWLGVPLIFEGYLMYVAANQWFEWIDQVNAIWGNAPNRRIIVLLAGLLLDRNPFRILQKIKENLDNVHILWEPVAHLHELENYLTADLVTSLPTTSHNAKPPKPIQTLLPTSQQSTLANSTPHNPNPALSSSKTPALFVHSVPTRTAQLGLIRHLLTNANNNNNTQDTNHPSRALLLLFKEDLIPLLMHLLPEVNISMGLPLHLTVLRSLCTLLLETASLLQRQEYCPMELVHRWWEHPLGRLVLRTETPSFLPKLECLTKLGSTGDLPFRQMFHDEWLKILWTLTQRCTPSALTHYWTQYLDLWKLLSRRLNSALTQYSQESRQDSSVALQTAGIYLQAINTLIQQLQMVFPIVLRDSVSQSNAPETPSPAKDNENEGEEHQVVPLEFFLVFTQFLLHQTKVSLQGAPLHPCQALGLLETRALTFDRIIIPDVVSSAIRMHGERKTFLSPVLRAAMYLPGDSIVALRNYYTLFRLVAHAKEIHLLVPTRDEHGKETQPSTLIQQLQWYLKTEAQHLDYAAGSLFADIAAHSRNDAKESENQQEDYHSRQPVPPGTTPDPLPYPLISSSMPVWVNLNREQTHSQKNNSSQEDKPFSLSVSALTDLIACPYRYLLARHWSLTPPSFPPDIHRLDTTLVGSTVHYALQAIYHPEQQEQDILTMLNTLLADPQKLDSIVHNALVQAMTSTMPGESVSSATVAPTLRQSVNFISARAIVQRILEQDRKRLNPRTGTPKILRILHEMPVGNNWLSARIDRIEIIQGDKHREGNQIRLCDFKYSVPSGVFTLSSENAETFIKAVGERIQQIAQLIQIRSADPGNTKQVASLLPSIQQTLFRKNREGYMLQLLLYGYLFQHTPMSECIKPRTANSQFPDLVIYNMTGLWQGNKARRTPYEYLLWSSGQEKQQVHNPGDRASHLSELLEYHLVPPMKQLYHLLNDVIQNTSPEHLPEILIPLPDDKNCNTCPFFEICPAKFSARPHRLPY